MIMRNAVILFAICLFGIFPVSNTDASITNTNTNTDKRIIDIVYDNSGSMAFKDETKLDEADNYITKWVDADYAVRAFSALMEDSDSLYLFPMDKNREAIENGYPREGENYYKISAPDDPNIDRASESFRGTYYEGVNNALLHLRNQTGEKWLIILTDSDEKSKLETVLNDVLSGVDDIGILYVPIVETPERLSLNRTVSAKVIQVEPTGSDSTIFSQILEATDYIYKRNSLPLTETSGRVEFKLDVPIKELIVLMQSEGETVTFDMKTTGNTNQNLKERMDGIRQEMEVQTGLLCRKERSFQSYSSDTAPRYDFHPEFPSYLKIKDIQGEMISLEGNSLIDENHIVRKTISVKENESVNIYYQLDLGIEMVLLQDGEPVEENEIFEGAYEVVVYPINPDSGNRIASDAQMLKGLNIKVNGEVCDFGKSIAMEAVYPGTVSLEVNVEGTALEKQLNLTESYQVKEKIYPLVIQVMNEPEFFDYERMNQESIRSGEADAIHIKLLEETEHGNIRLRDTTIDNLDWDCLVEYKGLKKSGKSKIAMKIERVSQTEDEYLLYPYLIEKEDYNIYRDVICIVSVWRKDYKEESRTEQKLQLPLEAQEAVLEAELAENERYTAKELAMGQISYSLTCNGEEIPKKEWKNVSFRILEGGNSHIFKQTEGLMERINRLKRRIYWFYNAKDTAYIHHEITYIRRGKPCTAILEGEIQVIPTPGWLRNGMILFNCFLLAFFLYLLVNICCGFCFPPFFKCFLYYDGDLDAEIKIKPKWWQCFMQIVVPKRGLILRLTENQKEVYGVECPDLELQKQKRKQIYLRNWSKYTGKDEYRINNKYIYRQNAVMSEDDQFAFKDSDGNWSMIVFKKNLIAREDEAK